MMRKLDGIADQVDQYLTNSSCVTQQITRHCRQESAGQFQPSLLRPQTQQLHRITDDIARFKLSFVDLKHVGFDLGEVENVIQNSHQSFPRRHNQLKVSSLFCGNRGLQQQFRQPQDAIHRSPNFMTHVRQKLTLSSTSLLRRITSDYQLSIQITQRFCLFS